MQYPTPPSTSPLVTVEYLSEGQICIMTVTDNTPATIDAFTEFIRQRQAGLPDGTRTFYLTDFSKTTAGFTSPYGRQKVDALVKENARFMSFTAVVLPNTILTAIGKVAVNTFNMQSKNSQNRIFTVKAEAIQWLEEMVAKENATVG